MGLLGCAVLGEQPRAPAVPAVGAWGSPLLGGCPILQGCPNRSSGQTGTAGIVCLGKCLAAFSSLERNPAEWVLPQLGQRAVGHVLAKGITDRVASDCQVQPSPVSPGAGSCSQSLQLGGFSGLSCRGESPLTNPLGLTAQGEQRPFSLPGKRHQKQQLDRWRRLCLKTLKCY